MLKDLLRAISRDGYVSASKLSNELMVSKSMVEDGIEQLIRMGYILREVAGEVCASTCTNCPFAKSCSKEILKIYKISDKGNDLLLGSEHPSM